MYFEVKYTNSNKVFSFSTLVVHKETFYFQKQIYYRHHVRQMINMVSQVTVILCVLMGVEINYVTRYETLLGRNTAIQNTAFECI